MPKSNCFLSLLTILAACGLSQSTVAIHGAESGKVHVIVTLGDSTTARRGSLKVFAKHLEERLASKDRQVKVIKYCNFLRQLAKSHRIPLVEVYQIFETYAQGEGRDLHDLMLDGEHPNDLGHSIIANHIIGVLETFLSMGQP